MQICSRNLKLERCFGEVVRQATGQRMLVQSQGNIRKLRNLAVNLEVYLLQLLQAGMYQTISLALMTSGRS